MMISSPSSENHSETSLATSDFNPMTSSPTDNPFNSRDFGLVRVEVAVQATIFVATIVGNLLILIALGRRAFTRRPHGKHHNHPGGDHPGGGNVVAVPAHHSASSRCRLSRMDFMIIHLAIADLSVAFFNVLPQLVWDATGHFLGTDFLCRMVAFLQVCSTSKS